MKPTKEYLRCQKKIIEWEEKQLLEVAKMNRNFRKGSEVKILYEGSAYGRLGTVDYSTTRNVYVEIPGIGTPTYDWSCLEKVKK